MVEGKPIFVQIWNKLEPIMSSSILVAHNAPFDMSFSHASCGIME